MVDYKSFLKKDHCTLPECSLALNQWLARNDVCPLSIETLWAASGGAAGHEVEITERGLRVWFTRPAETSTAPRETS